MGPPPEVKQISTHNRIRYISIYYRKIVIPSEVRLCPWKIPHKTQTFPPSDGMTNTYCPQ